MGDLINAAVHQYCLVWLAFNALNTHNRTASIVYCSSYVLDCNPSEQYLYVVLLLASIGGCAYG